MKSWFNKVFNKKTRKSVRGDVNIVFIILIAIAVIICTQFYGAINGAFTVTNGGAMNIPNAVALLQSANYALAAPGQTFNGNVIGDITGNVTGNVTGGTVSASSATITTLSATTANLTTLNAPTGRTASYVIAASDAPANVKAQADYVCDGTADDVQIQAAIDALPAFGGNILLSAGNFYLSNVVLLTKSINFSGAGNANVTNSATILGGTTIHVAAGMAANMISTTDANNQALDIRMSNFTIDGTGQGAGYYGLVFYSIGELSIDYVSAYNTNRSAIYISNETGGIDADRPLYVWISNCSMNNVGTGSGYSVIRILNVAELHLTNNRIFNSDQAIYLSYITAVYSINNTLSGSADYLDCMEASYCDYFQSSNDYFDDCKRNGLNLDGVSHIVVNGDFFKDNGNQVDGVNQNGLLIRGEANQLVYNASITGCDAFNEELNNQQYGLKIIGDYVDSIVVTGNDFGNNLLGGISVSPLKPSFIITNNKGYIAPGEIRTISGTITGTASNNAALMLSVTNPFGQAVRVTDVQIEITANASTAATMDAGVGSSATADYTTMIAALPINPGTSYPYFYSASKTATYGQMQTSSGINWATGSGNQYLNFFNPSANASGTVFSATYTITVMGN